MAVGSWDSTWELAAQLLLSGYQVRQDGKLERVRVAATLSEAQQRADELRAELARRNVHPDVRHFFAWSWCSRTISTRCWKPRRAWLRSSAYLRGLREMEPPWSMLPAPYPRARAWRSTTWRQSGSGRNRRVSPR